MGRGQGSSHFSGIFRFHGETGGREYGVGWRRGRRINTRIKHLLEKYQDHMNNVCAEQKLLPEAGRLDHESRLDIFAPIVHALLPVGESSFEGIEDRAGGALDSILGRLLLLRACSLKFRHDAAGSRAPKSPSLAPANSTSQNFNSGESGICSHDTTVPRVSLEYQLGNTCIVIRVCTYEYE